MSLPQALADSAERWPDKDAVVTASGRVCFGGLAKRADAFAARLIELGLQRGDRVAVWAPNRPEWRSFLWARNSISK